MPRQGKWVFASPQQQGPLSATIPEIFWRRVREETGIGGARLRDCRHTYASIAIMRGESITTTARPLGHNDAQTTLKCDHLSDDSVRKAADDLRAVLGRA